MTTEYTENTEGRADIPNPPRCVFDSIPAEFDNLGNAEPRLGCFPYRAEQGPGAAGFDSMAAYHGGYFAESGGVRFQAKGIAIMSGKD